MSTGHRGEGRSEKRKAIGFSLKQVKQDIGNMPLAMEYRNVLVFPPCHQDPPLNEEESFQMLVLLFLGSSLERTAPTMLSLLGSHPGPQPVSQPGPLMQGISGSLTSPCTKLHWSESGAKFRQA